MRLTIRGGATIRVGDVLQYFLYLTRTVGIRSALQSAIQTAAQILTRGVNFERSRRESVENGIPTLRAAHLQWHLAVRNLISQRMDWNNDPSLFDIIEAHMRLHGLIDRFPSSASGARVTVLIPAYDDVREVSLCLESIFSFPTRTPFTVIVGDDASPNEDLRVLDGLPGVRIVRQPKNLGYVDHVNELAKYVDTEFLLTLNQDTIVCPGWLDELVDEMDRHPECSVVGPRIVDTEFKIREAGAILFKDGHAAHRGRGQNPEEPSYNYSMEVDYVSGCALLSRTSVWRRLGGLRQDFAPAYYDDGDYCLRIQMEGEIVRYAPLSSVVHFEGTSMGRDETDSTSLKHHQVLNRQRLASLHPALAERSSIEDLPWPDSHCQSKPLAVCVLERAPNASRDGGSVDFVLLIEYLVELGYRTALVFTTEVHPERTVEWRAKGVQCTQFGHRDTKRLFETAEIVWSLGIIAGLELIRNGFQHRLWIHHTSDCATRRLEGMLDIAQRTPDMTRDSFDWYVGLPKRPDAMWELERKVIESPNITLFVSDEDLAYCQARGVDGNFIRIPIFRGIHRTDVADYEIPALQTVGFVGSFSHSANPDAVEYFLSTIWPAVHRELPASQFLIWGSNISRSNTETWAAIPGVVVRGWFSTWEQVICETRVFVSPLRFGAGMKGKVLQSLLLGRPVIGTRLSFEGLDTAKLHSTFASDDPQVIADSLIESLRSDSCWGRSLQAGQALLSRNFYRDAEVAQLKELLERLTSVPG